MALWGLAGEPSPRLLEESRKLLRETGHDRKAELVAKVEERGAGIETVDHHEIEPDPGLAHDALQKPLARGHCLQKVLKQGIDVLGVGGTKSALQGL
jgi:hypothetical protein